MSETTRPHGSRFRDALVIINPGACDPSGVAPSIADACREMREHENVDTKSVSQDPAIRPMVYQLAHLFGVADARHDLVHPVSQRAGSPRRCAPANPVRQMNLRFRTKVADEADRIVGKLRIAQLAVVGFTNPGR